MMTKVFILALLGVCLVMADRDLSQFEPKHQTRPVRPGVLPATLPEGAQGDSPPNFKQTRPFGRPQQPQQQVPQISPSRPNPGQLTKPAARPQHGGFAPLPSGPLVEPRPSPAELTKPAARPVRLQTLPGEA
ncbi:hypothetical protein SK128_026399 [Halocaridina rubra]|uniref:Uncharacterized protein n=1 Tax=Halocaridina rubra TaxID=373956 RepID=A0AAN8X9L6_HALRR